jgi:hypothetical protein
LLEILQGQDDGVGMFCSLVARAESGAESVKMQLYMSQVLFVRNGWEDRKVKDSEWIVDGGRKVIREDSGQFDHQCRLWLGYALR